MKKLFFLLFICSLSRGQATFSNGSKQTGAQKTLESNTCKDIVSFANEDIKRNQITLFVQGGIAPIISKNDPIFEKKYKIKYNDLGCIGNKCTELYNQTIFDHLTKVFGNRWIKTVQTNTVGFKKWHINKKTI